MKACACSPTHRGRGQEDPGFRVSLVTKTLSKNTQQTTNKQQQTVIQRRQGVENSNKWVTNWNFMREYKIKCLLLKLLLSLTSLACSLE